MPGSCNCREHQQFSDGATSYLHKLSNKKVKADVLHYMKTNNLLPRNSTALCQKCIDYVTATLIPKETEKRKRKTVDDIIESICESKLNVSDLGDIAETIGGMICKDIDNDVLATTSQYRETNNLTAFSVSKWLKERNQVLVRFIASAVGCANNNNDKKEVCIAGAVDSIYKAKRLTYVAPLPFCHNLVSYYISGSKLIANMNSRQHPCGSYNTLKRWIRSIASQPLQTENEGDIIQFFDINQTVARNWRVTYGHKTTASVITMILNIYPKLDTTIQDNGQFSPKQWLYGANDKDTIQKITQRLQEDERNFNTIRNNFIADRLRKVVKENRTCDEVQANIEGFFGPRRKESYDEDPYEWVPSEHLPNKPTVKVGDPVLCNPCSYDSVKKVLQHLRTQSVSGNRKWTCAGCDGLPYVLGSRLLDKEEALRDILLVPGHGHMEINAVKACFKLLWDVCLEDLARMLGFRSPRALVCCKSCTDHHKAWMILKIFFEGTIEEILNTYVTNCNCTNQTPSVAGLYQFISVSKDKNFRFLCDATFNSVLAIFVFRCGVRRNNSKYINAGKSKFLKLFYGFNHTYYQEIIYRDLKCRTLAPVAVKDFMEKTESFTMSGHESKGEGGDFVLEAVNGKSKRWLPPGIPQQHHWIEVCRNLDLLDKIRDNTFTETGVKGAESKLYQRDISTELLHWRVKLRESRYVSNTRDEESPHTSLSGENLDQSLIGFETQCNSNFNDYFNGIAKGSLPGKGISLTPVFTTKLERTKFHDIRKKTKSQISDIIEQAIRDIQSLGHSDEAFVLEGQWQKTKVKKKDDMLMFYKEVVVALENATNIESDNEEEDDESEDSDED